MNHISLIRLVVLKRPVFQTQNLVCLDKHDYQNQQLTVYKGTLLVKMIA